MRWLFRHAVAGFFASCALLSDAEILPGPYRIFKTEPTFVPNIVNVTKNIDSKHLEPGYFFIAPHIGRKGYGPQIVDQNGELVWYGNPTVTHIKGQSVYAMNFRVCDYLGDKGNHLCYSEGRPKGGHDEGIRQGGANRILNHAYEPVALFMNMGNLTTPNPHEFNILEGGESFLQSVYQKRPMDLRPYKGKRDGWIYNGCFQEINIRPRRVIFQWCALDHMSIEETYLYLHIPENTVNLSSTTGGKGVYDNPWDFMHLNSIDKNFEGDYLVSSRHMSAVIKIAGPNNVHGFPPGKIIWRLNGKRSDFEVQEEAIFTRQHHARYITTTRSETMISVFNNAYDGHTVASRNLSSAMILKLDNTTMKATLDGQYLSPINRLSMAQGSITLLSSGNVHVGWGTRPHWTEFSRNGTLLYHALAEIEPPKKLTNYRSFKYRWVGKPRTQPKLIAYCQFCNGSSLRKRPLPVQAYVSWNGATEVASWRFSLSTIGPNGPWFHAGDVRKAGFETHASLTSSKVVHFPRWAAVDAIDDNGQVLGRNVSRTFVPSHEIYDACDSLSCFEPSRFDYNEEFSRSRLCDINWRDAIIVLLLLVLGLESWEQIIQGIMICRIRRPEDEYAIGFYNVVEI